MPQSCAVPGCTNRSEKSKKITLHKFPKDLKLRKEWGRAIGRAEGWVASDSLTICSVHFKPEDMDKTGQIVRVRKGAIPSEFYALQKKPNKAVKESHCKKKSRIKFPFKGSHNLTDSNKKGVDQSTEKPETKTNPPDSVQCTLTNIRCSKRTPKRKKLSDDFEYDPSFLKVPKKVQHNKIHPREKATISNKHKRAKLNNTSGLNNGENVHISRSVSKLNGVNGKENDDIEEREDTKISDKFIFKLKGKTNSISQKDASKKNNWTKDKACVLVMKNETSKELSKKLDTGNPTVTSHKVGAPIAIPKDKINPLPNDFYQFEFATPRKSLIFQLKSQTESFGQHCNTIQKFLSALKNKCVLTREAEHLLSAFVDLPKKLVRPDDKAFCRNLYFMQLEKVMQLSTVLYLNSPKSYNLVNNVFMLPEKRQVRELLQTHDFWPGFSREALKILRNQIRNSIQSKLCCVMFDLIKVQKNISFDHVAGKWIGHVDLGGGQSPNDTDENILASEILLFTAVGLGKDWTLPFGYFPVNGLSTELLENLVIEAITAVAECGLEVKALVCLGSTDNIKLARHLGCDIHPRTERNLVTSFPHPCNEVDKIHIVFGIRHLLLSLRSLLEDKHILWSHVYGKIEWKYLRRLLQESETVQKIDYEFPKAQRCLKFLHLKKIIEKCGSIFNSTTSSALHLANQLRLEDYKHCKSTAQFVADIHRVFDLMNARNPITATNRPPIHCNSLSEQKEVMMNLADRIMNLKSPSDTRVSTGSRWMSVVSLVFTLESVIELASELLSYKSLLYFKTYRVDLDHIDLLVNHLSRHGHWSDIPTCAQFRKSLASFFTKSDETFFLLNDFDGEDLTVGQGNIYLYRNQSLNSPHFSRTITYHSTHLINLKTDLLVRAEFILDKIAPKISCPECMNIVLSQSLIVNNSKKTKVSVIKPSVFMIKLLKDLETLVRVELAKSELQKLECLVQRISGEYFSMFDSSKLAKSSVCHYSEEPFHVIGLLKNVIRSFTGFKVQDFENLKKRKHL